MFINEYFQLELNLDNRKPRFGYDGFGEFIFYRTYSRVKKNGHQETWADVVTRVINGLMSIRKHHYIVNRIEWDEKRWQEYASEMAIYMFDMKWLPPGRGLWAMGTETVVRCGSMALNNCSFTTLGSNDTLSNDLHWLMDALMLGVGVGFEALRDDLKLYKPVGKYQYIIPDSREGWCDSIKLLLDAYTKPNRHEPEFDYSEIRAKGQPIRGFGGIASGSEPLRSLHNDIRRLCSNTNLSPVRLKTDLANKIGTCVVSGNVRRSAELAKGRITDREFLDLKDYTLYPERENFGYMSNNSAALEDDEDFNLLGEIARRVITRGEPGIINVRNLKYGRIGRPIPVREDEATGFNPCGEIPLESKELCNLAETFPTRCANDNEWLRACEFATFYASTVSLLPTHRPETNAVIGRNRRIGVGAVDITGWIFETSMHHVIKMLRKGYEVVTSTNKFANGEAGVPESIRKTTLKPGGSVPKCAGKTPGMGSPTFEYTIMNVRVAKNAPIVSLLKEAGVQWEPEVFDPDNTLVFKFPVKQGPSKTADNVSLWEQAVLLTTLQREWSDNAVSNTLYFRPMWQLHKHLKSMKETQKYIDKLPEGVYNDIITLKKNYEIVKTKKEKTVYYLEKWPIGEESSVQIKIYKYDPRHEEDQIESVLSSIVPLIKSCSLLPHTAKGVYRQMPQQGCTKEEYDRLRKKMKPINWAKFSGSDGNADADKYCTGDNCVI